MTTPIRIFLVMELVRRGELFASRAPSGGATSAISSPPSTFAIASGSVALTLSFENLLLDDVGDLKIADLGLSAFASAYELHAACGTPAYVAPKVIGNRE